MGLSRTLMVAGAGAALAYFLDPVSGKERRQKLRDLWDERMQGVGPMDADEPSPTIVVENESARRTSAK